MIQDKAFVRQKKVQIMVEQELLPRTAWYCSEMWAADFTPPLQHCSTAEWRFLQVVMNDRIMNVFHAVMSSFIKIEHTTMSADHLCESTCGIIWSLNNNAMQGSSCGEGAAVTAG